MRSSLSSLLLGILPSLFGDTNDEVKWKFQTVFLASLISRNLSLISESILKKEKSTSKSKSFTDLKY